MILYRHLKSTKSSNQFYYNLTAAAAAAAAPAASAGTVIRLPSLLSIGLIITLGAISGCQSDYE